MCYEKQILDPAGAKFRDNTINTISVGDLAQVGD